MKATSFLSFLFCIVMLLAIPFAPLAGVHHASAESFAAYLCGCVAVLSIVRMFARGGVKAVEVPAPGFRRYLLVLYRMFDASLFLTLAYHGHFIVASLVGMVLAMQLGALSAVLSTEADLEDSLRKAAGNGEGAPKEPIDVSELSARVDSLAASAANNTAAIHAEQVSRMTTDARMEPQAQPA
ncbi:hypothetical protein WS89_04060 [Burkholderia sp. MSMB1072]|uniref:hypothetical protein n=1 Tax=Burkholderia sp. MSMB1072 TaxID=1637871 RepID=UPI00076D8E4F|nr:hypothetical protein [Burkholderia sp. MSMB1072]KVH64466.1 hypothetical protein WS89_04060 [Burkholderia sp. MSMB1072]